MSDIRSVLKDNLIFYAKDKQISQKELSERLGVTQSAVSHWFKGDNSPNIEVVAKISEILSVPISVLLSKSGQSVPSLVESLKQKAPLYSSEALRLAGDYDWLDVHGKQMLRLVADEEKARLSDERVKARAALQAQGEQPEVAEELIPEDIYSIPLYVLPMSAGTGQIAAQEYPEDFLLKKRPPRGTSFIARVSGNSMEPTYYDGDLVFVHATVDIRPGQTGAFLMDGQLWIKELGDGVLISHNPEYDPIPMRDDIRCQGLVLGVCDESYFE